VSRLSLHRAQELCHAFWCILSIGIHHDHGVIAGGLFPVLSFLCSL
jgi:hypothetical protein